MPKKPSGEDLLNPNIQILILGQEISQLAELDIVSVTVSEDLEALSMFELKILAWDTKESQFAWVDDKLFKLGNRVEIQLGYKQELKTIIVGEITGLEPEFLQDTPPMLVIRGYDLRHNLLRDRQTRCFLDMKDSDIVSQIARENNLTSDIKDSKVKFEYLLQHNQTDWEFLQERASRIGYEVAVDGLTLYFRPHKNGETKLFTLTYGNDLFEFLPRLSTMTQVSEVKVQGWLPKEKEPIFGKAMVGDEGESMGGTTSGAKAVQEAFNRSNYTIVNQPCFGKAEADQMALGRFKDMTVSYITGEGTCHGIPDLRMGKVIEIKGIGIRFSGNYYVSATEHQYGPEDGYRTSFTVRRNAYAGD